MISIIELIEQRIIHYEKFENFQNVENFDLKQRLIDFITLYVNSQNAKDRVILNSLQTNKDKLKNLIEMNELRNEIHYKVNDDEKKIEKDDINNEKNDENDENDNDDVNDNDEKNENNDEMINTQND